MIKVIKQTIKAQRLIKWGIGMGMIVVLGIILVSLINLAVKPNQLHPVALNNQATRKAAPASKKDSGLVKDSAGKIVLSSQQHGNTVVQKLKNANDDLATTNPDNNASDTSDVNSDLSSDNSNTVSSGEQTKTIVKEPDGTISVSYQTNNSNSNSNANSNDFVTGESYDKKVDKNGYQKALHDFNLKL